MSKGHPFPTYHGSNFCLQSLPHCPNVLWQRFLSVKLTKHCCQIALVTTQSILRLATKKWRLTLYEYNLNGTKIAGQSSLAVMKNIVSGFSKNNFNRSECIYYLFFQRASHSKLKWYSLTQFYMKLQIKHFSCKMPSFK